MKKMTMLALLFAGTLAFAAEASRWGVFQSGTLTKKDGVIRLESGCGLCAVQPLLLHECSGESENFLQHQSGTSRRHRDPQSQTG